MSDSTTDTTDAQSSTEDPADTADDPVERAFHLCDRIQANGTQLTEDIPRVDTDPDAWGEDDFDALEEWLSYLRRRVEDLTTDAAAATVALESVRDEEADA